MKENIENLLDYIYNSDIYSEISDKFKFLPDEGSKKIKQSAAVCDSYIPDDDTDLIVNTLQAVIFTMRGLSGFDNCSNGEDPFVKDSASTKRKYKSLESEKNIQSSSLQEKPCPRLIKKMLDAGSKKLCIQH